MIAGATFHHLGVATDDLPGAIAAYRLLGYAPGPATVDDADAVEIVFLARPDGPLIELVAPRGEASPVAAWIKKRGTGAYHTCYEVPSVPAAIATLREAGWVPATACRPAPALGGRTIVFMFHPMIGLLELVEAP